MGSSPISPTLLYCLSVQRIDNVKCNYLTSKKSARDSLNDDDFSVFSTQVVDAVQAWGCESGANLDIDWDSRSEYLEDELLFDKPFVAAISFVNEHGSVALGNLRRVRERFSSLRQLDERNSINFI